MKRTSKPPTIIKDEKSPIVLQLSTFIEHQGVIILQQAEQIQQLKDEIARLKNQPPRPKIKPSRLENKTDNKKKRKGKKRPGSKKRKKTAKLKIHDTIPIPPDHIPEGSVFKGSRMAAI
ncbi:MAG: hypothetical protein SRB2_04319 [Desulfobacteraceae bacterium Eth-SRB2]|nr:MAG: hypothetical protein SRB2_04319 [Desulfobacteraceae bacterium Eth-SRB2]